MAAPDDPHAACETSLDMLGIASGEDRTTAAAYLVGFAIEYLCISIGHISRPRGRELRDALASIAKSARQIEADLIVLRYGRQTANEDGGGGEEQRRALFPLVVGIFQNAIGMQPHEWRGGFEDPLAGMFSRISSETGKIAAWYDEDRIADPTRIQHPGLTRLILRLANIYEDWTGRHPTAPHPGDRPDYQSPFVRFVHAFAPMAGIESGPPAKTIARALVVYSRLPQNLDTIRRTDPDPDPCHSSSDNLEQTGNHDHEN